MIPKRFCLTSAVGAAIAIPAAMSAAPASACTVIASRVPCADAGNACIRPLIGQLEREKARQNGLAEQRALRDSVRKREASPTLDMAFDLARVLVPNRMQPIGYDDSCTGPSGEDEDSLGNLPEDEFREALRAAAGLPATARLDEAVVASLSHARVACNDEFRRPFADYLRGVVPAATLRRVWHYILSRAGGVPDDATQPVTGVRLTALSGEPGAQTIELQKRWFDLTYVDKGWNSAIYYLETNPDGRRVMQALSVWQSAGTRLGAEPGCPNTQKTIRAVYARLAGRHEGRQ